MLLGLDSFEEPMESDQPLKIDPLSPNINPGYVQNLVPPALEPQKGKSMIDINKFQLNKSVNEG
jgi:hypothetical protein